MAKQVSDFIVERLSQWGVKRIFGFPGDGINGLLGAMNRAKNGENRIQLVQVRHEENAAFMACAHAKFTGETGVCLATSGPGAIHLLNGLYDAKMDHQPVVAIVGQQARSSLGGNYQQEVDLLSLFKDVAGEYVHMCSDPMQTRHLIDRAFRTAISERTVTCIIFPNDVQELDFEEPARAHGTIHTGIGYERPIVVPADRELRKAAAVLNEGKKVAILVGAGALEAAGEAMQIAELLGAGVAKALLGKAVLPDDLPYVTGAIGLLGTKPSYDMMMECDTLLMVGSSFPYSEYLPKEGKARGVQIDISGKMLSIRYPMEVCLHGDSKETLRALLPLLEKKIDRTWQNQLIKEIQKWWKVLEARSQDSANPINPQLVFWELSKRLPDNCIFSADSGSTAAWFARDLKVRWGMKASLSGNLATMCPAMPYTIAAKFAFPERVPICLIGDGAFQMLGMNGMITIAKYWKEWADPRLVILVLNNQDLNMVTWEQRAMLGDPRYDASQGVPDIPYAEYAKLLGFDGIKIDDPARLGEGLDWAFSCHRPVLIEACTDPSVPMLPPHVDFKEMKAFGSAMTSGDSKTWEVIKQTYKDVVDEVFHAK